MINAICGWMVGVAVGIVLSTAILPLQPKLSELPDYWRQHIKMEHESGRECIVGQLPEAWGRDGADAFWASCSYRRAQ